MNFIKNTIIPVTLLLNYNYCAASYPADENSWKAISIQELCITHH